PVEEARHHCLSALQGRHGRGGSGLPLSKTSLGLSGMNALPVATSPVYLRRPNHPEEVTNERKQSEQLVSMATWPEVTTASAGGGCARKPSRRCHWHICQ